jgi:hypothetical protein
MFCRFPKKRPPNARFKSERAKKIGKGLFGLVGGLTLALFGLAQYDEGTKRSLSFWIDVFPIYIHYRFAIYLILAHYVD